MMVHEIIIQIAFMQKHSKGHVMGRAFQESLKKNTDTINNAFEAEFFLLIW